MKNKNNIVFDKTGFASIKNLPSKEELSKFYNQDYFQNDKGRPTTYRDNYDSKELEHINLLINLNLYSIEKLRPSWEKNPGSLIEVGVGEGFFLSRAKERGWNVLGLDFSNFAIKKFNPSILNEVKIGNAFDILLQLKKENKKFDVCIMNNILEHVYDPRILLNNLKAIINENGLILIKIPNDFSKVQLKALQLGHIKKKFWIVPLEHLHYFNINNIIRFMNEIEFKVVDMYSTFPIDFYLFHPGSNYIENENNGKDAHRARLELDLLMANSNLENYHNLCQSFAKCYVGRNITILIELK